MTSREDANENNLTETFQYDALNRLTQAQVSQNIAPLKTFAYDAIGNLLSKSDVGNYAYPMAGSALPHAVTSISGGAISTSFTYDANGNQTAGLGRSISYTSFNKPSSITQGSGTLFFTYDADHQRFQQTAPEGLTLYFDAFGVHKELFISAASQYNDYLMVGGALIGLHVLHFDNSVTTRYFRRQSRLDRCHHRTGAVPWWSATATMPGQSAPSHRRGRYARSQPDHGRLHRPGAGCPAIIFPAEMPRSRCSSDSDLPRRPRQARQGRTG